MIVPDYRRGSVIILTPKNKDGENLTPTNTTENNSEPSETVEETPAPLPVNTKPRMSRRGSLKGEKLEGSLPAESEQKTEAIPPHQKSSFCVIS
jgi:hypothetical protein